MRKIFAIAAIALTLGGCQNADLIGKFVTVGVSNPITTRQLAEIEQTYLVALRPTVAYLETRTCKTSEAELTSWLTSLPCADYARKVTVRGALQSAQSYRRQLSTFVRTNRTIDAQTAYNGLLSALAIMQQVPQKGTQ